MRLSPLYHWSPADRYDAIRRDGLRPGSAPTVASVAQQHICCSPDPMRAWAISGAMTWVSDVEHWDLWQVTVADGDEVHVRAEFGPDVHEVMIRTVIPPDRLWWLGRRYDLGTP